MVTVFQSRELVRDELVTLFQANGSWQEVYGYYPSAVESVGKTPLLFITSEGTAQSFSGLDTNPASYRFRFASVTIADRDSDNWDSADAEDKLDDLDRALRQVIRNYAGSLTYADNLRFEEGFSVRDSINVGGKPYERESRFVIADLAAGSKP